jgi:hypothetical protein
VNSPAGESEPPRRPTSLEALGFEPQGMVPWLDPRFLVKAAIEVQLSDLFAHFADKREVEAGLPAEPPPQGDPPFPPSWLGGADRWSYSGDSHRDEDGALWIDYASDVGEGFAPTYTVAWLLAQGELPLEWNGDRHQTRRGRLLVLGGDQVYPSASWPAYRDRFVGPYTAALPFVPDEAEAPHLYAIPGNHDWYDGLTSFLRVFCQGAWIGGWKTRQRRSYFALRLSDTWWLWATDIQLDTYMDGPQLEYFRKAAEKLDDGDRVILVTAKPSWVGADPTPRRELMKEGSWEALSFVEQKVVAASGAEVAVTITGDKHHYARYTRHRDGNPKERITAGGGGAHTTATHGLPPRLTLRREQGDPAAIYELEGVSPTPDESRAMRRALLSRIFRTWTLGSLIGSIYALLALLIADAVKDQGTGLEGSLEERSYWEVLWDAGSAWTIGAIFLLLLGLMAFARRGKVPGGWRPLIFGALHSVAHVLPAVGFAVLGLWVLGGWDWAAEEGLLLGWFVAAPMLGIGFAVGTVVFWGYLRLANRGGPNWHATEIYGGLASTEYKNFLRLRLGPDGDLTIYPVGIRTSTSWELRHDGAPDIEPWFVPAAGESEPEPRLIEEPITLR